MKTIICALVLASIPALAAAAERPDWAFGPPAQPGQAAPTPAVDDGKPRQVPGSGKTYTQTQLEDPANPPDWFPDEHPPMPAVVAHGKPGTAVRACVTCHVGNGHGHPENSRLPGATAAYLARQLIEFKSGARAGTAPINMINIAKGMTDEEIRASADYFAGLKLLSWTRVVETDTVPKFFFGRGNMRLPVAEGGSEPIGHRIVELPEDSARVALRDPHSGFIAYVPVGSVAKGEALVTTGGGKTIPCAICHGQTLKGLGDVPGISGRSPSNVARQLYYIQTGERGGPTVALMKAVVEKLSGDDVLAISAYLASREP
jgi:cytochrome c553